ncbi:MAG: tRNA lysidine(34) synthetase TilS [Fibrobacterota bacterium]
MATLKLIDHLRSFWKQLKPTSSVLVGLSGGADSVALIHLLHLYRQELGVSRIAAAHVNHSLRGEESDADEAFVRELCEKLEIELFTIRLDRTGEKETGIEEWARGERYSFFHKIKSDHKFDCIATAHTADDQAETLIMRLMRGAGIRGMRGILPVRDDGVIRPLINVERKQLIEWLESRNISYRTDSSNFDPTFRRNWVRQEIIPKLLSRDHSAVINIAAVARRMGRVWELLGEEIDTWIDSNAQKIDTSAFSVRKEGFRNDALASEGLMSLFDHYGIPAGQLHLERVMEASSLSHGEHLLPQNWRFYPGRDRVYFIRKDREDLKIDCVLETDGETVCPHAGVLFRSVRLEGKPQKIPEDNNTVCLDVSEQDLPLRFRNARKEDRFWPLGASRETDLESFLKKQGVPQKLRKMSFVVVSARDEVVWIPGMRISRHFRIRSATERFLRISFSYLR